jgi:CRP-like cAMP-binding protein
MGANGGPDHARGTRRTHGDNRLLAALPPVERERLLSKLEWVHLTVRQSVFQPHTPITHVYFPINGVISLVAVMADGVTAEVATVGNEGMVGLPVFLGAESSPLQAFCQIESDAWRLPAPVFRTEAKRQAPLCDLLHRYTQAQFNQMAQTAACNQLHSLEERCARWLLMTHDRVDADRFRLTQEFLASMLGVRRPTVSIVMSVLRRAGLLMYTRGAIAIVDRRGVEAAACACYQIVWDEYDRLLGQNTLDHR